MFIQTRHDFLLSRFVRFRVNGGAGYTMFKDAPVIYRSRKELRELIIDWVKRNGHIPATPTNNWRLLPLGATLGAQPIFYFP